MYTVCVENIGKRYQEVWVLRNINIAFEQGKIHGLIGRNGAGKTMLLKLIAGLATPTEGTITVNGKKVGVDVDIPDSIGAIIEVPGFLPSLSGFSNLKYLAALKNNITDTKIKDSMRLVGLSADDKKHVSKYSLGMRQRLGFAQAIMEDPSLLLLDEPMNGLDRQGVEDMKELLKKLRGNGKTILLASHHMEDITELCDTVCLMDGGHLEQRSVDANTRV